MTTRSDRLGYLYQPAASLSTAIYTTPVGYRTIVKQLSAFNGSGTTQSLAFYILPAGAANGIRIAQASIATATASDIELWHVMLAGDVLGVIPSANKMEVYASGAELVA